jgi:glutamate-1-semialdehyde aminotransferase
MEDTKVIEAAKKFKEVLCDRCPNNKSATLFDDVISIRSIKEINQMLALDKISPDVRATLEWVTYKREII